MKRGIRKMWLSALLIVLGKSVMAQDMQRSVISSQRIQLCENKTTNIIFPYSVKSVDRGSGEVLAQIVQGFSNVLQLKAGITAFKETNVTVITSDGKLYSFLADYYPDPKVLNISLQQNVGAKDRPLALPDAYNEAALDSSALRVMNVKPFLHQGSNEQQMRLQLAGIYLKDGLMWFKLRLSNHSQVDYPIDGISFSVVDKKQVKRTARQEVQLQPMYHKNNCDVIGGQQKDLLLAFEPFTLSSTKRLKIQVSEKGGGRYLVLTIKPKKLLQARLLK